MIYCIMIRAGIAAWPYIKKVFSCYDEIQGSHIHNGGLNNMDHRIDLPGIGNARELGGYTIGDKVIRSGMLLRTARIDQAGSGTIGRLVQEYRIQRQPANRRFPQSHDNSCRNP